MIHAMNPPRLLGEGRSFYHCVSRVVDRRFVFEDGEKEVFRRILRIVERFTGVRVVTYCLMSNHFHLLLDVPDKADLAPLTLGELLDLLPQLHDETMAQGVRQEIERAIEVDRVSASSETSPRLQSEHLAPEPSSEAEARIRNDDAEAGRKRPVADADAGLAVAGILARYEKRRGDLSIFMKMLKIRVTKYMNHRLDRVGTLWESRFKSVLVEGDEAALMTVAAYIDLNPVRAGIVARPEDYAYSGYGESCSKNRGAKAAKRGLGRILRESLGRRSQDAAALGESWRRTLGRYRLFLYIKGVATDADSATGGGARRGIARDEVAALLAGVAAVDAAEVDAAEVDGVEADASGIEPKSGDGALASLAEELVGLLHGQVRYFTDGGAFGRAAFVESVSSRARAKGGAGGKRRHGAKRMRGADWGPLRVLRDLQKAVFGPRE